jgi:hypothetical protein
VPIQDTVSRHGDLREVRLCRDCQEEWHSDALEQVRRHERGLRRGSGVKETLQNIWRFLDSLRARVDNQGEAIAQLQEENRRLRARVDLLAAQADRSAQIVTVLGLEREIRERDANSC